ncbi:hypothetical protein HYV43_05875 [Candidatus Micrarchaeota archaeon]|nr:hypothetical protein [Candidatus Micrarchaeota archaeon]
MLNGNARKQASWADFLGNKMDIEGDVMPPHVSGSILFHKSRPNAKETVVAVAQKRELPFEETGVQSAYTVKMRLPKTRGIGATVIVSRKDDQESEFAIIPTGLRPGKSLEIPSELRRKIVAVIDDLAPSRHFLS